MRKLWHIKNAPGCKTGSSGLGNRRVQFSWIRLEFELRFSTYLVMILRFMERDMTSHLYIYRSRPIVSSLRPNQSINCSFIFSRDRVNVICMET
jgi:hypothetical protein